MTKQDIIRAMEELPEDASIEDAMEALYLIYRVEQGIRQVEDGETVSHEDAKAHLSKWLR